MAARLTKIRHDDNTRAKIQAALIIKRLHGCVMGEITLDAQQVSCAKALLNKVLPDLSAITLQGDSENPLEMVTRIELVAPGHDNSTN